MRPVSASFSRSRSPLPPTPPGAQSFVEKKAGQIKKIVDANGTKEETNKVIDEMIDYDEITRRSLGQPCPTTIPSCTNHWSALTPDQQTEMTGLYTQLVAKKVRDNAQKTKDFDITYRGTREGKEEDINKVRTEAQDRTKPRDPPTQIDYIVKGDEPVQGRRHRHRGLDPLEELLRPVAQDADDGEPGLSVPRAEAQGPHRRQEERRENRDSAPDRP